MKAGHAVRVCMAYDKKTHRRRSIGDGLFHKLEKEEWEGSAKWADLLLTTDNVRFLRELDVYRRRGFPVLSPSYEAAQLELDREKGQRFLAEHGIKTIPYKMFSDYNVALKYVQQRMERMVSKPCGDKNKALSYVSKSPADLAFMLMKWKEKNKNIGKFILQDFVPGTEFSCAAFLGPKGFTKYSEECFEFKPLMNDDIGPNTGEQGSGIKYTEDSSLAREMLAPIEGALIKMGCTGSVCVGVIVDGDGAPWPLEFTMRLGWPSFNIVQSLHQEPCEWIAELLNGNDIFEPSTQHAIGVVMTIPEYPYESTKDVSGVPLYNLDDDNEYRDFLAPCETESGYAPAMEEDRLVLTKRLLVSAGDYLCVATGIGGSVREAQAEAYKAARSIEVPDNLMYRTDIGDKLKKAIPALQEHGYAEDWVW